MPAVLFVTQCLEPIGTLVDDMRQVGKGLDVVDDGRLHIQADGGREVGRLQPRLASPTFQRVDQPRLLPAYVGASPDMDGHLQVVAGAHDVLSQQTRLVSLVHGRLDAAGRLGILAADVDEGMGYLVGPGGDDRAFDDLVGVPLHELTILERPGLGLVPVDDQIGGALGCEETPFHAGREGCPSSAEQVRRLDQLHQLVPGHAQRLLGRLVPAGGPVTLHGVGVSRMLGHPAGDDLGLIEAGLGRLGRGHFRRSCLRVPRGWKAG